MGLLEKIEEEFKAAYKAKDDIVKSALSNLKAALKSLQIEKQKDLSDEDVVAVAAKKVKQHKDSITEFEKGGRTDLVENETKQMAVLQKYIPAQMSEEEVRSLVKSTITELNATPADFGKVMKAVMVKTSGQSDGAVVSKIVKEELAK